MQSPKTDKMRKPLKALKGFGLGVPDEKQIKLQMMLPLD